MSHEWAASNTYDLVTVWMLRRVKLTSEQVVKIFIYCVVIASPFPSPSLRVEEVAEKYMFVVCDGAHKNGVASYMVSFMVF